MHAFDVLIHGDLARELQLAGPTAVMMAQRLADDSSGFWSCRVCRRSPQPWATLGATPHIQRISSARPSADVAALGQSTRAGLQGSRQSRREIPDHVRRPHRRNGLGGDQVAKKDQPRQL